MGNVEERGVTAGGTKILVPFVIILALVVGLLFWWAWRGPEIDAVPPEGIGTIPAAATHAGRTTTGRPAGTDSEASQPFAVSRGSTSSSSTGFPVPPEVAPAISSPASGVPTTREVSTAPADTTPEAVVSLLKSTSLPLETREEFIVNLARRGDADAVRTLKAVANAEIYLNWAAVKALGEIRDSRLQDEAAMFLAAKFRDPDSRIVCESLRGYGKLRGEQAVEEIVAAIQANRERPDGHQDLVANAGVKLLGEIASPKAFPFLKGETTRATEKNWNLEYGSELIRAMKNIGIPEARKAMLEYADLLSARIPDDPLAKRYFEDKIAEAKASAQF